MKLRTPTTIIAPWTSLVSLARITDSRRSRCRRRGCVLGARVPKLWLVLLILLLPIALNAAVLPLTHDAHTTVGRGNFGTFESLVIDGSTRGFSRVWLK